MPVYRIYFLRPDGCIFRRKDVAASSDDEALRQAEVLNHDHGVEVWQDARRLGAIGPDGPQPKG